jgi:3-(methylthio)propanoyl-CoA dehydrogenase
MPYKAPVQDMLFNMRHVANIDAVAQMPGFEDAGFDTAQAVLEECAKFNEEVLAPLNWQGDINPSTWDNFEVTTTPGFKEAFKQYGEAGWQGLQHPTEFGGQGLPKTIGAACGEMLNSANMSFALCPLLTDGAIEALITAASDDLKKTYLEKLMDWHHELDRATSGFGPGFGSYQSGATSRRQLQSIWYQNLHHVW